MAFNIIQNTITILPTSNVVIMFDATTLWPNSSTHVYVNLKRGSTVLRSLHIRDDGQRISAAVMSYVDTPGTAGPHTYSVEHNSGDCAYERRSLHLIEVKK